MERHTLVILFATPGRATSTVRSGRTGRRTRRKRQWRILCLDHRGDVRHGAPPEKPPRLSRRVARFEAESVESFWAPKRLSGKKLPPVMRRSIVVLKAEHPSLEPDEISPVLPRDPRAKAPLTVPVVEP